MKPLNVQFFCGENRLDGWDNWDADLDCTELPLPYGDNSVDMVFCEHGTEHITTHEFLHFLDECRRILKPDGVLRICMPVLDRLTPEHARDMILGHGHKSAWTQELGHLFILAAGFRDVLDSERWPIDGHHAVIGMEKDTLETGRWTARK